MEEEKTVNTNQTEEMETKEMVENTEEKKEKRKDGQEKKNLFRRQWLKIPAFIFCVLSVFGMILGGLGMAMAWGSDLRSDKVQTEIEAAILEAYGQILIQDTGMYENRDIEGGLDGLDGGSIRYTVTSSRKGQKEKVLYSNAPEVGSENCKVAVSTENNSGNYRREYNVDSFYGLLSSICFSKDYYAGYAELVEEIEAFVYAGDKGLFYCYAGGKYFLMPEFFLTTVGEQDDMEYLYQLTEKNGTYFYVCENADVNQRVTDETVIESWINDGYSISFAGDNFDFRTVDSREFPADSVMEYGKDYTDYDINVHDMTFYYHSLQDENMYSVYLSCGDVLAGKTLNNGVKDYFAEGKKFSAFVSGIMRFHGGIIVGSLAVFVICFCYLMAAAGKRRKDNRVVPGVFDKIPFGILTMTAGGAFLLLAGGLWAGMTEYTEFISTSPALCVAGITVLVGIGIGYCMSIAVRIKTKNFWRYTVLYYVLRPLRAAGNKIRSNVPLFVKGILILTGISFVEFLVLITGDFGVVFGFFFLYKIVEYLVLIHILYQIDQIDKGAMRTATGNYSEQIPAKKMLWEFRKIAENINHVSDGISVAVEEKMKSERFKTELITNVSHDIKTPLTSIINYVDLIKKEEIESPVMQEYVEVLDRQSQRLKKLIEDLMEASKASTGNLPVHMELCDATVMLTQVIGEFKERAEAKQLELVVESPRPPVNIMADGRHLWRVIDNLMSNICKYAMPGTRVYINLEQFHGMVIMTFRNISKSKLNISSEELMERFVRGDSSRNTEGSGLGLSIAQSLTGLMNGNMAVQIDGDLFKAIVSFNEVVNNKQ